MGVAKAACFGEPPQSSLASHAKYSAFLRAGGLWIRKELLIAVL